MNAIEQLKRHIGYARTEDMYIAGEQARVIEEFMTTARLPSHNFAAGLLLKTGCDLLREWQDSGCVVDLDFGDIWRFTTLPSKKGDIYHRLIKITPYVEETISLEDVPSDQHEKFVHEAREKARSALVERLSGFEIRRGVLQQ